MILSLPPFPPPGLSMAETVAVIAGIAASACLFLIALIYVPPRREEDR